ncbi:MAG: TetR/AcrR family transcriptional regulator [Erysipelotrichaceae bacterium]|nr:TetR/AcrR family transcriptional regulator [Erysipelotrichaceae bacterium]
MYTGRHTKAIESQTLLINALLECLNEKELKDVQVKDICQKANLTRQTFYSLFSTKENALYFHLKYNCNFILDKLEIQKKQITTNDLANEFSCFYTTNKKFLKILVDNNFYNFLYDYFYNTLHNCRIKITNKKQNKEYLYAYISGSLIGLIIQLLKDDKDSQEISKITTELLNGKYLIN